MTSGRITAIVPQQRSHRVSIFVDNAFFIGVDDRTAHDMRLTVGQDVTPESLERIVVAAELHRAREAALRLLDVRPRTKRELATRLAGKGHEQATIDSVLQSLDEQGFLDDRAFAQQWIEEHTRLSSSNTSGKQRLKHELAAKGVAKTVVEELTASITTEDQVALAHAAAAKFTRKFGDHPTQPEIQRTVAHLQRRGFGWDAIKQALPAIPDNLVDDIDISD